MAAKNRRRTTLPTLGLLGLLATAVPSSALSFGVFGPVMRTAYVLTTATSGKPLAMAFEVLDLSDGTPQVVVCRHPYLNVCVSVFGPGHKGDIVTVTGTQKPLSSACGVELSAESLTFEQKMP